VEGKEAEGKKGKKRRRLGIPWYPTLFLLTSSAILFSRFRGLFARAKNGKVVPVDTDD
jgi:hypothetical protein